MSDSKWIVVIVLLGIVGTTIQNVFLREELNGIVLESRKDYEQDLEDVYFLMKSDSARLYTIMDTEVRILHYAKPHKHAMWACPECAEQKQKGDEDDVQSGHKHVKGETEAGG